MPLTLRQVLDLDVVRRGSPHVVAGAGRLDVPVRWVHALELTDVGRLLRGGELVLSTGIALPESPSGLADYVASLAQVGVAGLAVELGRRYTGALPPALVTAAATRGVPLVELRREVAFIEITEAVHARIIDELLLSRAAATLALGHLLTSQAESLERQAHRTLISALIEGFGFAGSADADDGEAAVRARAMGVEVTGRDLVAVVVRLADPVAAGGQAAVPAAAVLGAAEEMASACRADGVPALVGALDDVRAGALLSLPPGAAGGNKALAAARAHLARPTFYQRLRLIERVLGVSLADPESRASLHVALLAHREGR